MRSNRLVHLVQNRKYDNVRQLEYDMVNAASKKADYILLKNQKYKNPMNVLDEINGYSTELDDPVSYQIGTNKLVVYYNDPKITFHLIFAIHIFQSLFPLRNITVFARLNEDERTLIKGKNKEQTINLSRKHRGAFTVSGCTQGKTIWISKREEIVKLLFHEMIHASGIDGLLDKNDIIWKGEYLNINEAYTEFLSILMNTIYLNLFEQKNLDEKLELERVNGWFTFGEILSIYDLSVDQFLAKKQDQPIYLWEYILLRSCLMENIDQLDNLFYPDKEKVLSILKKQLKNIITYDNITIRRSLAYTSFDRKLEEIGTS